MRQCRCNLERAIIICVDLGGNCKHVRLERISQLRSFFRSVDVCAPVSVLQGDRKQGRLSPRTQQLCPLHSGAFLEREVYMMRDGMSSALTI